MMYMHIYVRFVHMYTTCVPSTGPKVCIPSMHTLTYITYGVIMSTLHFRWRFFQPKWNIPPPCKHRVGKLEDKNDIK